jgi:hypothetical protein
VHVHCSAFAQRRSQSVWAAASTEQKPGAIVTDAPLAAKSPWTRALAVSHSVTTSLSVGTSGGVVMASRAQAAAVSMRACSAIKTSRSAA